MEAKVNLKLRVQSVKVSILFREELWLAKGVKLDRKDREIIKQNANKVGIFYI